MRTMLLGMWMTAALLPMLASAQQSPVLHGFDCRGENPAWQLDANRQSAVYNTPTARGKREVVFRGALQALAHPPSPAIVWRGDSTHLPRETLVAALREEACPLPANSKITGAWRAIVSVKAGETQTGCCVLHMAYDARVAPVADLSKKPAGDWARFVPDMLPAINRCIASDGGRAKWISRAAPLNAASGVVRIVETSGRSVDCVADVSGRGAPRIDPVAAGSPPLPGTGNPLFYPAREQPPMVACGKLERVLTPRGGLAGYLHYDPC
jgi:hypothetical protein